MIPLKGGEEESTVKAKFAAENEQVFVKFEHVTQGVLADLEET